MENDADVKEDVMYAMPTLAMLPANNYKIHIGIDSFSMTVPCKGTYLELDPDFFSEEDGKFAIFENNVLSVSTITKVLFGLKSYPDLADNQLFCPIKFEIDKNTITITGRIVTILGD
jgi:hypothetical protein